MVLHISQMHCRQYPAVLVRTADDRRSGGQFAVVVAVNQQNRAPAKLSATATHQSQRFRHQLRSSNFVHKARVRVPAMLSAVRCARSRRLMCSILTSVASRKSACSSALLNNLLRRVFLCQKALRCTFRFNRDYTYFLLHLSRIHASSSMKGAC